MQNLSRYAFNIALYLPCLAVAGPFGLPDLSKSIPSGSGFAKSAAPAATARSAISNPSEMFGLWRSTGIDLSDPEFPFEDTLEVWIGANGKVESRMGGKTNNPLNPEESVSLKMQSTGDWETEDGNFIVTLDRCQIVSSIDFLSQQDCVDSEPDVTALSDYTVTTINGKQALVILYSDPEEEEDNGADTLYYVGSSPAFTLPAVFGSSALHPQLNATRHRVSPYVLNNRGITIVQRNGRLLDLRGRTGSTRSPW
jgi:hypothetical protein